jgi:hypothetical protein
LAHGGRPARTMTAPANHRRSRRPRPHRRSPSRLLRCRPHRRRATRRWIQRSRGLQPMPHPLATTTPLASRLPKCLGWLACAPVPHTSRGRNNASSRSVPRSSARGARLQLMRRQRPRRWSTPPRQPQPPPSRHRRAPRRRRRSAWPWSRATRVNRVPDVTWWRCTAVCFVNARKRSSRRTASASACAKSKRARATHSAIEFTRLRRSPARQPGFHTMR